MFWLGGVPQINYNPGPAVVMQRFCTNCDCAQHTDGYTPCWNCGCETQPDRPAWWPTAAGSVQAVRNGNSFSFSELNEPEEEVA